MSNENKVVLPEPDAWLAVYEDREGNSKFYTSTHKELAEENDTNGKPQPLYTEQQVRALLATATGLPAQAGVNRYCSAGMCVSSDKQHDPKCTAAPQAQASGVANE